MLDVLTGFAIIFTVIAAGWWLAQKGVIGPGEERLQLNRIAFYVATPSLIFSSVAVSDTTSVEVVESPSSSEQATRLVAPRVSTAAEAASLRENIM
mgnify:CR=1 FL=1